ncbi:MAG: ferric reductase-like transmembrane domain-containing protein [Lentisphaerota bacterium]
MKKYLSWACLILNFLVIVGFWYWNTSHSAMGNLLTSDQASRLLALGRLAGLLAAGALLLQLVLIGRVHWLESVFGLDRLSRFHHFNGLLIPVFLLLHGILILDAYSMQYETPWLAEVKDLIQNWEDIPQAITGFFVLIFVVVISVGAARRKMKYEVWYYIHLSTYIAIVLAFGHQLKLGGDFLENKVFTGYWYALYLFVFGNLLLYRVLRPLYRFGRHRFCVERVERETDDVTSVYITGRAMDRLPIEAGQFMILRFLAPGFRFQAHPFSMSCVPDGKHLRVSIKRLGDYTRQIPNLPSGTPVLIDGPHGVFTARHCRGAKALLITGGIGITPIRPVAEVLAGEGKDVVLLYGNRTRKDIVFEKELAALESKGRVAIHHVFSAEEPGWTGAKGYVDLACIEHFAPDFRERDVFLCGPPVMMKKLVKALRGEGMPRSRLHYERFAL